MASSRSRSPLSSLTSPTTKDNSTNKKKIEQLCKLLQTATRLEDRKEVVRELKSLSKKCKAEVGSQSITLLANILRINRTDLELLQLTLETLINLTTYNPDDDEAQDLIVHLTKLFIKNKEHLHAVFECIMKNGSHVRRAAIQFVTALVTNCTEELVDIIAKSGSEITSKLVFLLKNKHEDIRPDVLALLQIITCSNEKVKGIVVSSNGFERLFAIMNVTHYHHEVDTVKQSLYILSNLLKDHTLNQRDFHKDENMKNLAKIFQFDFDDQCWSKQKETNVHLLLQIIQVLVSTTNSHEIIIAYQRSFKQIGKEKIK